MNRNGLVLWEGPSAINGEPIVVIATGLKRKSANAKIGANTVQVWSLPRDVAPNVAVKTAPTRRSAVTASTDRVRAAPATS